jgi:hypothetical protein
MDLQLQHAVDQGSSQISPGASCRVLRGLLEDAEVSIGCFVKRTPFFESSDNDHEKRYKERPRHLESSRQVTSALQSGFIGDLSRALNLVVVLCGVFDFSVVSPSGTFSSQKWVHRVLLV